MLVLTFEDNTLVRSSLAAAMSFLGFGFMHLLPLTSLDSPVAGMFLKILDGSLARQIASFVPHVLFLLQEVVEIAGSRQGLDDGDLKEDLSTAQCGRILNELDSSGRFSGCLTFAVEVIRHQQGVIDRIGIGRC